MQEVLIDATMVPLDIARNCLAAIELHEEYAKKGTRIAISDVGVGVIYCKAALQGAKLNVLINTQIMKDEELKTKVENELEEIERVGLAKADQIYNDVEKMLRS
jgi:formiminotetrahydrofolate cyclodeaminase